MRDIETIDDELRLLAREWRVALAVVSLLAHKYRLV
jgi:hypothetical protein